MPESAPRPEGEQAPFNPQRPGWQARAACRPDVIPHIWQQFEDCDSPMDLFFPEVSVPPARREAIASVCGTCPVRAECEEHGVLHEPYGWWGGKSASWLDAERLRRHIPIRRPEVDPRTKQTIGTYIEPGHGTPERYARHRREGEYPCQACREAQAEHVRPANAKRYRAWREVATPEELEAARERDRQRVRSPLAGRRLGRGG